MPSLGNDLASIRKELNLSIQDVHQSTKIPVAILESIENNSIFTTLDENKTYIRSYIRSYARALKIDENAIIKALDQNDSGNYTGFLTPQNSDETTESDSPETPWDQDQEVVPEDEESVPDKPAFEQAQKHAEEESSPEQHISPPPTVNSVDWADMGRKFTPLQTKSRMWVTIGILFLGIAIIASFVVYQNYFSDNETDSQARSNPLSTEVETPDSDSLQIDFTAPGTEESSEQTQISETTLEALPDTLSMVVYAAYGVLEPVRVFTDVMNSLNPYWIEHGDAYQFEFVNTIRIRGQYSRMELLLNGHVVQDFRQRFLNPESGMLEIDRNVFEGDPLWLQPPPDSLDIAAPSPTVIQERPTFN